MLFFLGPLTVEKDIYDKNIEIINSLLIEFAKEFSDRNEYNAYKHSLRLLHTHPKSRFESKDKKLSLEFESEDGFIYLEKK